MFTTRNLALAAGIALAVIIGWYWLNWTEPSAQELQATVEQAHYYQETGTKPPTPNHNPDINGLTMIALVTLSVAFIFVISGLGWLFKRLAARFLDRRPIVYNKDHWLYEGWPKNRLRRR